MQNTQNAVEDGHQLPVLVSHILFNAGVASSALTTPMLLRLNAVTPADQERRPA